MESSAEIDWQLYIDAEISQKEIETPLNRLLDFSLLLSFLF